MGSIRPVIGARYVAGSGESVEVIAYGTGGIVVEYQDGRVELVDTECWQTSLANTDSQPHGAHATLT